MATFWTGNHSRFIRGAASRHHAENDHCESLFRMDSVGGTLPHKIGRYHLPSEMSMCRVVERRLVEGEEQLYIQVTNHSTMKLVDG
jgi:hypothetical protein